MTTPVPASVTLNLTDLGDGRVSVSMSVTNADGTETTGDGPITPAMLMALGGQSLFRTGFFEPVGLLVATSVDHGLDTDVLVEKLADALMGIDLEAVFLAAGGTPSEAPEVEALPEPEEL